MKITEPVHAWAKAHEASLELVASFVAAHGRLPAANDNLETTR